MVQCLAAAPDGRLLATGGTDKAIRLWDPATGTKLGQFTGHPGRIRGLAFSPDGTRLASAAEGGTDLVWDVTALARLTREAKASLPRLKSRGQAKP
jgi:WD40 repeat protein